MARVAKPPTYASLDAKEVIAALRQINGLSDLKTPEIAAKEASRRIISAIRAERSEVEHAPN